MTTKQDRADRAARKAIDECCIACARVEVDSYDNGVREGARRCLLALAAVRRRHRKAVAR